MAWMDWPKAGCCLPSGRYGAYAVWQVPDHRGVSAAQDFRRFTMAAIRPDQRRVDVTHTFSRGLGVAILPVVAFWLIVGLLVMVLA